MTDSDDAWLAHRTLHGPLDRDDWIEVAYARHRIPEWAVEEVCMRCGKPATHKIGDESGPPNFHNLTAYACCGCLLQFGMNCQRYPPY